MGGAIKYPEASDAVQVRRTEEYVCGVNGAIEMPAGLSIAASATNPIRLINLTTGLRTQLTTGTLENGKVIKFINPDMKAASGVDTVEGDRIRVFWTEIVNDSHAMANKVVEITISPNTFPGVYRVVGDTFIRNANTGKDEMFQFVIGKAKVTSNVTLQLQAEGKQQGLLSLNSVNCWNLQKAA